MRRFSLLCGLVILVLLWGVGFIGIEGSRTANGNEGALLASGALTRCYGSSQDSRPLTPRGEGVIRSIPSPDDELVGMVWAHGNLWVARQATDPSSSAIIYQINPQDGTILHHFATPFTGFILGLTFDGSHLWLVKYFPSPRVVYELPTTGDSILSSFTPPGTTPRGITWDGDYLWISDNQSERLFQVDTLGTVVRSVNTAEVLEWPMDLTWVAHHENGSLWVVDNGEENDINQLDVSGDTAILVQELPHPDPASLPEGICHDGFHLWLNAFYGTELWQVDDGIVEGPVSILDTSAGSGDTIAVPIYAEGVAGSGICSVAVVVACDPAVMSPSDSSCMLGPIAEGWDIEWSIVGDQIDIAMKGVPPLAESGILVYVDYVVNTHASAGDTAVLHLVDVLLNGECSPTFVEDGLFTVLHTLRIMVGSSFTVGEGETLSCPIYLLDNDPSHEIELGASHLPDGATFETVVGYDSVAQNLFWTPDLGVAGPWCVPGLDSVIFYAECPEEQMEKTRYITVHNENRQPRLTPREPFLQVMLGEELDIEITAVDSDFIEFADDSIKLTYEFAPVPLGQLLFTDNGNGTGHLVWTPDVVDQDTTFTIILKACDLCGGVDSFVTVVEVKSRFTLEVKKAFVWPGQQHVRVPVFLTNWEDSIGGWELLMEYDITGGRVVGVELCDSASVDDPAHGGPNRWFFAPWHADSSLRPECFTYQLNADGHANWVRIVGIQNMAWPQVITPDIPPGEQQLLFCLIFDVSPEWDGHNVIFGFHTRDCTDNTLSSCDGMILWGPDRWSVPVWTCRERPEHLRAISLTSGHGLGVREVDRGDVNCDVVPYSVADAMMFIGYLVYGDVALMIGGEHLCGSLEAHCYAADIDGDSYCFTVADLITLIRIINGYESPLPKLASAGLTVIMVGNKVSIDREIGAALFVFDGEGEVRGEDALFAHRDGRTFVLAHTLDDRLLKGELFTINGNVKLESAEAVDFFGGPMTVNLTAVPPAFSLAQNHPNPFNSVTEVSYDLPKDCHVKLEIYNLLGQRVATLVDEGQRAGRKMVRWEGRDVRDDRVASGVYLYRIEADDFVVTRRMVILR